MPYQDVGTRIRDARKRMGMNQEELAELARLNRVTIAKYESGKVEPGAQALSRIADALEVTVDQLLGREDIPQQPQSSMSIEAKILAHGIDKMPEANRERALAMMKLVFSDYAEYFEKGEPEDDDA